MYPFHRRTNGGRPSKPMVSWCVFRCVLKLLAWEDALSHWLHLFNFSLLAQPFKFKKTIMWNSCAQRSCVENMLTICTVHLMKHANNLIILRKHILENVQLKETHIYLMLFFTLLASFLIMNYMALKVLRKFIDCWQTFFLETGPLRWSFQKTLKVEFPQSVSLDWCKLTLVW